MSHLANALRRTYRRLVLARLRRRHERRGEVFFDKHERDGAYHWDFYYAGVEPYYKRVVDAGVELVHGGVCVLDIGCGDGLVATVLSSERACRVTDVDLHPLALASAREKNRNANRFEVGAAYAFGETGPFDAAVAMEIFEHVNEPERLLGNARRALRLGGTLVISTPVPRADRPRSKYHVREYTETEFETILNTCFHVTGTTQVAGEETTVICRCVNE